MNAALTLLLRQPWYPCLHEFNLLPSRLLHASWGSHFAPPGVIELLSEHAQEITSLHRHWSAYILKTLGLTQKLFLQADAPQLPLAILPFEEFNQFVRVVGVMVLGRLIRHTIRREDVRWLNEMIGVDFLQFARIRAQEFYAGIDVGDLTLSQLPEEIPRYGAALIICAMQNAPAELLERVRLRLSADAQSLISVFNLSSNQALDLLRQLLSEVNPSWLSAFSTPT